MWHSFLVTRLESSFGSCNKLWFWLVCLCCRSHRRSRSRFRSSGVKFCHRFLWFLLSPFFLSLSPSSRATSSTIPAFGVLLFIQADLPLRAFTGKSYKYYCWYPYMSVIVDSQSGFLLSIAAASSQPSMDTQLNGIVHSMSRRENISGRPLECELDPIRCSSWMKGDCLKIQGVSLSTLEHLSCPQLLRRCARSALERSTATPRKSYHVAMGFYPKIIIRILYLYKISSNVHNNMKPASSCSFNCCSQPASEAVFYEDLIQILFSNATNKWVGKVDPADVGHVNSRNGPGRLVQVKSTTDDPPWMRGWPGQWAVIREMESLNMIRLNKVLRNEWLNEWVGVWKWVG